MDLLEYIASKKLRIREFAKQAKLGYVTIYKYLRKEPQRLTTILKIYNATEGAIDITQAIANNSDKKSSYKKLSTNDIKKIYETSESHEKRKAHRQET